MKKTVKLLLMVMAVGVVLILSGCYLLKPQAPTNLTATALSASSIKLTWQGNGSFIIYRSLSLSGSPFSQVATTDSTNYIDNGLSPRTTYYYKVVAKNQFGVSDPSNIASATTKFIYSVSGYVQDQYAYGIADVTIKFSGGFSQVTTDQNGQWSKSGLSGTVVVTPEKTGWTFAPPNTTVASTQTLYFEGIRNASVVAFPDPVLDSIIRSKIGKATGDIYVSDLTPIASIENNWPSPNEKISNLEGIQYCVNLKELEIVGNNISNISQLASLTQLQVVNIWYNNVSDITPIKNLPNIKKLYISYNPIPKSNWAFLKNWTWLEELGIGGLGLINSDIAFLPSFTNLIYLDLNNNSISDISPVASLTNLRYLLIVGNRGVRDLSPVASLVNLYDLNMGDISATNLAPLKGLKKLESLSLFDDNVVDISPLASLTALRSISMQHNKIKDISSLEGLTNLEGLDLSDNEIEDISPLVRNNGMNSGDYVDLRENLLDLTPSSTALKDIETLQKRGVTVKYQPQK
ncbi:leucine-rich repeat domain-containing protein [Mesoaciditoga lauensis]|uniref:leucine-rich repeat domain-containing protein n=1 Tax=Mesoaciditoga lauensis TaxID=1495039 RepID=UPI00056260EC|nr:leucine-rich repeat domain-containing protein [Mesoaciditoga lauensis]